MLLPVKYGHRTLLLRSVHLNHQDSGQDEIFDKSDKRTVVAKVYCSLVFQPLETKFQRCQILFYGDKRKKKEQSTTVFNHLSPSLSYSIYLVYI